MDTHTNINIISSYNMKKNTLKKATLTKNKTQKNNKELVKNVWIHLLKIE